MLGKYHQKTAEVRGEGVLLHISEALARKQSVGGGQAYERSND
jgi:hypothetical protein